MENSLYYLWAQHKYFLLLKFVTVILVTNKFCIYVYVVNREEIYVSRTITTGDRHDNVKYNESGNMVNFKFVKTLDLD